VDATLISASSTTKDDKGIRNPNIHQTKKGSQWQICMKAHIGVESDSGLAHTVTTNPAKAHDYSRAAALLHSREEVVFADSDYWRVQKREEVHAHQPGVELQIATTPGQRKSMDKSKPFNALKEQLEMVKHLFLEIKCQFGHCKMR
jgi:IS5 family transposase